LLTALFPLTDVMATGHHAAVCAGVERGTTCVVIGDGAVGLCGVLAARRIGAERIIVVGHHEDRLKIARGFGATHVISSRGDEAIGEISELTDGGANHVLECVGAAASMELAIQVARPGGTIGYVGVPHGVQEEGLNVMEMFFKHLTLRGGGAPARAYMNELMADVLAGKLDPSPVFDMTVGLDGIPEGYATMNERRALKVLIKI
jgi:alcohol dehydrogenase